jgi:hypothetical protein
MRAGYLGMIVIVGAVLCVAGCATPQGKQLGATSVAPAEGFPLGKLEIDLPSFRTLEDLKAWGSPDHTERHYLFEKGQAKVAVIVVSWGSGDWRDAVFVYAYDQFRGQWNPWALWDTDAKNVQVIFDKRKGTIHVRSGKGVPIFSAQIEALQARRTREW